MNFLSKNDAAILELTNERDSLSLRIADLLEQLRIKDESSTHELTKLQDELTRTKVKKSFYF